MTSSKEPILIISPSELKFKFELRKQIPTEVDSAGSTFDDGVQLQQKKTLSSLACILAFRFLDATFNVWP